MIFNNDQGSQFTSDAFTGRLDASNIAISWDGRGSYFDNIFIERLSRSVKYEEVYLNDYDSVNTAYRRLKDYFNLYDQVRLHQWLDYRTQRANSEQDLLSPSLSSRLIERDPLCYKGGNLGYLNLLHSCLKDGGKFTLSARLNPAYGASGNSIGVLPYSLFIRLISVRGEIGDLMVADSILQMYKVELRIYGKC